MYRIALTLLLILFTASVNAGELVREFKGTGNTTTASFEVEGPWLVDWRLESPKWQTDSRASRFSALEITLVEANTGRHVGRVAWTQSVGDGLRLFDLTGRYALKVSTTHARWTIRIEQLTDEEAKLYTPKDP